MALYSGDRLGLREIMTTTTGTDGGTGPLPAWPRALHPTCHTRWSAPDHAARGGRRRPQRHPLDPALHAHRGRARWWTSRRRGPMRWAAAALGSRVG
ncbi:MAG: hypothetical protein R2854_03425 [Caldilineaceae bacterium]